MSLMNVTAATLSQQLDCEVPVMYVVIAKHSVLGMDDQAIQEVLGCTPEELAEAKADPIYKDVRVHVGAAQAQSRLNQTQGWDAIEDLGIQRLLERLPYEKDSEFLLRVAAVANKAQRRQSKEQNLLDPSKTAGRVAVTLTQRLVDKLRDGTTRVEERQLSISDGSMRTPTFDEVDSLLQVSRPGNIRITTESADVMQQLDQEMQDKGF